MLKVTTLAYCEAELVNESLKQVYMMKSPMPWEHYLIYRGWPINKAQNKKDLELVAKDFQLKFVDFEKPAPIYQALNALLKQIITPEDKYLLNIDADSYPLAYNFDLAMFDVLESEFNYGWVSLFIDHATPNEIASRPHVREVVNNKSVYWCKCPMMLNVSMINLKILDDGYKQMCPVYGGTEIALWNKFAEHSLKLGILKDYHEDGRLGLKWPDIYRQWKLDHVRGKFPQGFDKYLEAKK